MTTLSFNPQIFTVKTKSGANHSTWDLLTLDGETPAETVYFMNKQDGPSADQQIEIAKAIGKRKWEKSDISDEDVICNYSIDVTIFDASNGAYDEIVERLNELQDKY